MVKRGMLSREWRRFQISAWQLLRVCSRAPRFLVAILQEPQLIVINSKRLVAMLFRRLQLHIVPLEDVAELISIHPLQFANEEPSQQTSVFGIYVLKNAYVHQDSGLIMHQPTPGDWPSCIRESGIQDYQELSLQRSSLLSATRIAHEKVMQLEYSKHCIVFHVGIESGTNFFHFLIDHLPRLLLLLQNFREQVIVIHLSASTGFIGDYLELVKKIYQVELYGVKPDECTHLRIKSPLVLISDVSKRLRYSVPHMDRILHKARTDPQLEALGINFEELVPSKFRDHQFIHHWAHLQTNRIFKQSSGLYEHSQSALDSLYRFGVMAVSRHHDKSVGLSDMILITRDKNSSSQRFLKNEHELLSECDHLSLVDFGKLPVIDQIVISNKCSVMVGVTGAGLANAVYMESGRLVIDITPLGYYLPAVDMIEELCKIRSLHYVRVFSSPLDGQGITTVDVDLIKDVLERHQV